MPLFDVHAYYGATPMFDGLGSVEAVQAAMERFGMDAIALISARARHADIIEGNHQLRQVLDGDRGIFGYATLSSAYPDESIQEMRLYLAKHNFIGSALFPHEGTPVLLADAREILNAQRRFGKPLLIYVEDRDGVRAAREIATEFDQLKIVLLNMGGHDWRAAVTASRHHANIFLDISGTLDSDKIEFASSVLSPRKLVFGSAIPYADPNIYTGMLEAATSVGPLDRRRIGYQNALALFGIEAEVE